MVAQMPADIASSAGVPNGIVSDCFVAVQHMCMFAVMAAEYGCISACCALFLPELATT